MPALKLADAFLSGLCANSGRLMCDPELCDIYDFPENFLLQDEIQRMKPHEAQALKSFVIAALAKPDGEMLTAFLSGMVGKAQFTDNNHHAGRNSYRNWFKRMKIASKIHILVEEALVDSETHPKQLLAAQSPVDTADHMLPEMRGIYTTAERVVAQAVYGRNALTSVVVPHCMSAAISCLLHHAWERLRKQRKRAMDKMNNLKDTAQQAAKEIENSAPATAQNVKDLIKAVKAYEQAVEWHPKELEAEGGVNEFLATVKALIHSMKGIPDSVEQEDPIAVGNRGRARAKNLLINIVASEEDVKRIWEMYVQYFRSQVGTSESRMDIIGFEEDGRKHWRETGDLGVQKWRNVDEETLDCLLGYRDGRPTLFTKYRSKSGQTAWDAGWTPAAGEIDLSAAPDLSELRPMWHQKVGVAAMAELLWTRERQPGTPGVLLADKVGLGKSVQIMLLIALLIETYMAQEIAKGGETARTSPIIGKKFFAGLEEVPNQPHLLVVPNGLINQWVKELKTFFDSYSIDIYQFPTQSKDFQLWFTQGSWAESRQPFIKRIVIVAHSVSCRITTALPLRLLIEDDVQTVATQSRQMMLTSPRHNRKRALADPRAPASCAHKYKSGCLWEEKTWCTLFVDEAQFARRPSALFHGLVALGNASAARVFATATPLVNEPSDVANIGRMLGIPAFLGSQGDELDQKHKKAVAAEKRKVGPEARATARELTVQKIRGLDVSETGNPWEAVKIALHQYMDEIRDGFSGRIIKRNEKSIRFDGKPLNEALPPFRQVVATCQLNEEEIRILDVELDHIVNNARNTGTLDVHSANFYLYYRTRVAYAFAGSGQYPAFSNMDDWLQRKGTKLDLLVKLLQHHLSHDERGAVSFNEQGLASFPEMLASPEGQKPQSSKVLVFQEFPMMSEMMISVLRLHNIPCLTLNGSMTLEEREDALHKFKTDPQFRVMLTSNVGGVGLNLTVASTIIVYDMVWSKIALDQILGRAHRFGQEKEVLFYLMVALGTVDVLMVDCGFAKGSLLRTFLNDRNCNNQVVVNALSTGFVVPDETEDLCSPEEKSNSQTSRKSTSTILTGSKITAAQSRTAEEKSGVKAQSQEIVKPVRDGPASQVTDPEMKDDAPSFFTSFGPEENLDCSLSNMENEVSTVSLVPSPLQSVAVEVPAPTPRAIESFMTPVKAAKKRTALDDSFMDGGPSSSKQRVSTDSFPQLQTSLASLRATKPRPTPLYRPAKKAPTTNYPRKQIEANLIGMEESPDLDLAPTLQPPRVK